MSIIIFIIILVLLILVHEFGHFLAAKLSGMKVQEFGIGFPPRAVSIQKGETKYSLNWIPFGGFVSILGENPTEKSGDPGSFSSKPRKIQALVVAFGVFFNIL